MFFFKNILPQSFWKLKKPSRSKNKGESVRKGRALLFEKHQKKPQKFRRVGSALETVRGRGAVKR